MFRARVYIANAFKMKQLLSRLTTNRMVAFLVAVLCSLTVFDCFSLRAQGIYADTREFFVYFPQKDSWIHKDYLSNAATLDSLAMFLASHEGAQVDSVRIEATASPEGDAGFNMWLAGRRAEKMEAYLLNLCPELSGRISSHTIITPWPAKDDDLVYLRYAKFQLVFKSAEVMREPEPVVVPDLVVPYEEDDGEIIIEYVPVPENEEIPVAEIPEYAAPVAPEVPEVQSVPEPDAPAAGNMWLAVKSNLLYDSLTMLNVELEVPVGRRMSVMVEDVFPWWNIGNKYCLQHWEMGAEARFWFTPWASRSEEKLRGFFAGVYGMSALFDFQWDTSLDYQGEYWSAGVVGGWCKPIGRKKNMNLELSLGLGYAHVPYQHYLPTDIYDKLIRDKSGTGHLDYIFGPTKAKVSLVIPICSRKKEVNHE